MDGHKGARFDAFGDDNRAALVAFLAADGAVAAA